MRSGGCLLFRKVALGSRSPMLSGLRRRISRIPVWAFVAACLLFLAAQARAQNLLNTLSVDTLADSTDAPGNCTSGGVCSLRDAINQANADAAANSGTFDEIVFEAYLSPAADTIGTITLTSALPTITEPVNIQGPGAFLLTISGNNQFPIFTINESAGAVNISRLTLAYGKGTNGGAISFNGAGFLTITNCTLSHNTATGNGGAIYSYNAITLSIEESTIADNSAPSTATGNGNGGGIYFEDSSQNEVLNSTLTGNSAGVEGGAIYAASDARYPESPIDYSVNDTITGNSAGSQGGGVFIAPGMTPNLFNSIVSGNTTGSTADSGDCVNCRVIAGDHDQVGGTPPTLGPLAWNGGPTKTMMPLPGSTAICAGSQALAVNAIVNMSALGTDQRGFAIPPTDCPAGNVDIGAVQSDYLIVNTAQDSSDASDTFSDCNKGAATCSLRDDLGLISDSADIIFDPKVFSKPQTIALSSQLPPLNSGFAFNIEGPGQNLLTIDSTKATGPVFYIAPFSIANFSGITISNALMGSCSQCFLPGGAAIGNQGEASIIDSTLSHNASTGIGGFYGGAVDNGPGADGGLALMLISGSTLSGNSAGVQGAGSAYGGGGAIFNVGLLAMIDDTVSGNSAISLGAGGGGILTGFLGALTMANTTVSGNTASDGGGIFNNQGDLVVTNSTISGNTAYNNGGGGGGGGILNTGSFSGQYPTGLTLANSIVAGNFNQNNTSDCVGCAASAANHITVDAASMIGGNPELGLLQVNGLNTALATMLPQPGSPAMGTGNLSELYPGLTTDERGYPRTTGGKLDLGAAQTNYTGIAFYTQPTDTTIDTDITPAPQVEVLETDGNLKAPNNTDAVSGVPITLAYSDAPNMGGIPGTEFTTPTVVGAATVPLVTFGSLEPTAVATGVYLTASSGPLSGNSNTFDVIGYNTITTPNMASVTYSPNFQFVSLSATVRNPSAVVGMGTVTFTVLNGATPVGTPLTVNVTSTGAASGLYTLPPGTSAGNYTIEAVYNPAGNFQASSGNAQLTVNKAASVLSGPATVSFNYGAGGTIPIAVAGESGGSGILGPGGNVTYAIATGAPEMAGIALGKAMLAVPATFGVGTYNIAVSYAGDSNYDAATSIVVKLTVLPVSLTLTANNATRVFGQANPMFTGSFTGEVAGNSFVESFTTTATLLSNVGKYAIVPSVTGIDLADYTAAVTDGTLTITPASTSTTLTPSSGSITPGENVALNAQVSPQYAGTPTGTVSFYDGGTLLGTAQLKGGLASLSTSALAPGQTHILSATYNGSLNFTTSQSPAASVIVAPLNFTVRVDGQSTQVVIPGGTATYQLNVAPLYSMYPGLVTFTASGLPKGMTVTFSPASIPANGGVHTVSLTVNTLYALSHNQAPNDGPPRAPLALACLLLPLAAFRPLRRQAGRLSRMLCLLLLLAGGVMAASLLNGCASNNGFFLENGSNYTVNVTGTSGNIQHSVTVTLNVK